MAAAGAAGGAIAGAGKKGAFATGAAAAGFKKGAVGGKKAFAAGGKLSANCSDCHSLTNCDFVHL